MFKLKHTAQDAKSRFYLYSVDVLSGWTYYTPVYAAQELALGKDPKAVAMTRLIGLGAHALVMRPIGKVRNQVAQKLNVTKDSPWYKQIAVNFLGVTPIQTVVYGGMLTAGTLMSNSHDWKQTGYAWLAGAAGGAFHSLIYGPWQDRVRSYLGVTPAISSTHKPSNLEEKLQTSQ